MTKGQIDQAQGEELAALVAEHIMGYRWFEDISVPAFSEVFLALPEQVSYRRESFVEVQSHYQRDAEKHTLSLVPTFSTDHNAAALVLDKMREFDHHLSISSGSDYGRPDKRYIVRFATLTYFGLGVESDSLPEAICRAALHAIRAHRENRG